MKKYCPECGFANEYDLNSPSNCSKCKKSMSFGFVVPEPSRVVPQKTKIVPRRTISRSQEENELDEDNEGEYEDESELSDYKLNKKSISVDFGKPASYSLKDLANSGPSGMTREKGQIKKGSTLKEIQRIMKTTSVELE